MINQPPMDSGLRIADGLRLQWEKSQAEYVLLYPEGMIKLNNSAAEILKLCDGHHSVTTIIAALKNKYTACNVTDLTQDIYNFLTEVLQKGWITVI